MIFDSKRDWWIYLIDALMIFAVAITWSTGNSNGESEYIGMITREVWLKL